MKRSTKIFLFIFLLFLISPFIVHMFAESYLKRELKHRELGFKKNIILNVSDVELGYFDSVTLKKLSVSHRQSPVIEIKKVHVDLRLLGLLDKRVDLKVEVEDFDLLLSDGFIGHLQKLSEKKPTLENKESRFDLKLRTNAKGLRLLRLNDGKKEEFFNVKEAAFDLNGKIEKERLTEFKSELKLETIAGSTLTFKNSGTPEVSTINGTLRKLSSKEIEKILGERLPLELTKGYLDADLEAKAQYLRLNGVITPEINVIKVQEPKDPTVIEKVGSSIANSYLEDKGHKISIKIPFTFDKKLMLNFRDALR